VRNYARYNRALVKRYERWMVAMHYAKHTQWMYRKSLLRFVGFLGKRSIPTVNHLVIHKYLSIISEDGVSLNGAYRELGILRIFYDFLNLGGVVHYVPPRYVRLRRPWAESPRPLTESQVHKLICATRTPRERALVEFFYATGCRLSEVIHLKIEDLDFETRTARVRGKLNKVRTVMFTTTASDALRTYLAGRQKGYVFLQDRPVPRGCLHKRDGQWKLAFGVYSRPNGPRRHKTKCFGPIERLSFEQARSKQEEFLATQNFWRPPRRAPLSKVCIRGIFKRIASRAGLKSVTPHTLRRTFATHLYNNGAGIDVIKVLMGHVWITTTMKYARMGQDQVAKIFDQCHPGDRIIEKPIA
jgi:integrase/recombinase XerD